MRVLLVTSRSPMPAWRGNQVRTVEWLEALAGHQLALVCPGGDDSPSRASQIAWMPYRLQPSARVVGLCRAASSGRPLQEGLYDTGASRRAVADAVANWIPDIAVVQMVRCGWAIDRIRTIAPELPVIFDAVDAMGLHFDRAARAAGAPLAFAHRAEAGRCRQREAELAAAATITVAVSERDLAEITTPGCRSRVIPVAGRVVSTTPVAQTAPVILLSGNLGYRPTVRGALWFAREVWPQLRTRVPNARWVLAGARPAAAVRRLGRLDGVEIHADVPDLEPFLNSSRLAIAPMSSGSGVPMKVLEAMAAALPAVVDPWAAAGLVGEAAGAVAVASGVEGWVATVEPLLRDAEQAAALGRRGHELWLRCYHPDRVAEQIRGAVEEAANVATDHRGCEQGRQSATAGGDSHQRL